MKICDILIVDDNKLLCVSMALLLEHYGYKVVETPDVKTALLMLTRKEILPLLIITDFNMPGMNGVEFTQAVRVLSAHKQTPILMLSNETSLYYKEQAYAAGVTEWLDKSSMKDELLPTVQRIAGRVSHSGLEYSNTDAEAIIDERLMNATIY